MQLRNELAQRLHQAAQALGLTLVPGYHGGHTYCAGLLVGSYVEAFELGQKLGPGFGEIGFDVHPAKTGATLVFRDALVSA